MGRVKQLWLLAFLSIFATLIPKMDRLFQFFLCWKNRFPQKRQREEPTWLAAMAKGLKAKAASNAAAAT
jgi:hypothetical protein